MMHIYIRNMYVHNIYMGDDYLIGIHTYMYIMCIRYDYKIIKCISVVVCLARYNLQLLLLISDSKTK